MPTLLRCAVLIATLAMSAPGAAHDAPAPAPITAVAVTGIVENRLTLNVDALRAWPAAQIVTLRLPGKDSQVSEIKGVRLRDILDKAKIVTKDHNTVKKLAIVAIAGDGYKAVFSWNELFNAELGDAVLVVFERDGAPLAAAEGPLALVSGKDVRGGPRHVKWLQSVDVRQIVD